MCVATFIVSVFVIGYLHKITVDNVYTDPTTDYNIIGQMSEKDTKKAMELTESDNQYIRKFKDSAKLTQADIEKAMRNGTVNKDYIDSKDAEITTAAERVMKKITTVNSEK